MCCETENKSTSTSKTTAPAYIENASQMLTQKATDLANKPVTMPKLEIAALNADQQSAFQKVRDLAGAPGMSTERVVDEDGRLGKIADYMNPWVNPAFQKIDEAEAAGRKRIGAGATSAGAFGDARHGILEVGNVKAAQEARAGAAFEAFDKALAARQTDLTRFTDVDKTNFNNTLQSIQALLTTGGIQQGQDQAENEAVFNQFMAQYGHDFDVLAALRDAISGAAGAAGKTTTTEGTETTPDNSILQTVGGVAGKLASSKPVAGAIASII
jgi:hypothetical protein